MATESAEQAVEEAIELKDPGLAALLAWLVPGLGHWYQGRRAKAALYFICIMGLFAYGVYLSSSNENCLHSDGKIGYGRAAYFSWRKDDFEFLKTFQLGVGLPALPALVQANRMSNHRKVWWGGFMAPPRVSADNDPNDPNADQPIIGDLHRQLHRYFELAGFFTMIAGLLNVLAIYDAWAGPVVIGQSAAKNEDEDEEEKEETGGQGSGFRT